MIPQQAVVVIVSFPRLIASLTDPTPDSTRRVMVRVPRKLHLVHGVFLAEEPAAVPTVDASVERAQPPPAWRIRAYIVASRPLPVFPRDELFRVDDSRSIGSSGTASGREVGDGWYNLALVGFEHFETTEFLVDYGERLEALSFQHLLVEPRLDLVLRRLWKLLVHVVQVSV